MKNKILKIGLALLVVALMISSNVFIATNPNLSAKFQKILTIGMSGVAYAETPDYTCDGAEDNVQVKEALDALPATGGKLVLFAGDYDFHATVDRAIDNVCIEGGGYATYVNAGATAVFSDGGQINWVFKNFRTGTGGITHTGTGSMILGCWIGTTYQDDMVYGSRGATIYVYASDALNKPSATVAGLYYLCTGTNDQDTIDLAIIAAAEGRVVLSDGTFYIAASDHINLISNTTLEGQGAGTLLQKVSPASGDIIIHLPGVTGTHLTNIAICNLRMDGTDSASDIYHISGSYVDNLTVENVKCSVGAATNRNGKWFVEHSDNTKILNCKFDGTSVQLTGDIDLDDTTIDSEDALVEGCSWVNTPSDAGCIGNIVKRFKVVNCDFIGDDTASRDAIDLSYSPDVVITGNTILGMKTGAGVLIEGGRGGVISGNTITKCKYGIVTGENPSTAIQSLFPGRPGKIDIIGNTIRETTGTGDSSGISVMGIPRVSIIGNIVENAAKYGIAIYRKTVDAVDYDPDYCIVQDNQIIGFGNSQSWAHGILLLYASYCYVSNNLIDGDNHANISGSITEDTGCDYNVIFGTIFRNPAYAPVIIGANSIVIAADIDDTPVDGATTVPISSNWAFDYGAAMGTSLDANDLSLSGSTLRLDRDRNIILTAGGGWATTTAGCAYSTLVESTTNKENIWYADFDKDTDENIEWSIILPNDFATDGTATMTAQFVWTAASGTGNVTWACKWISYGDNEVIDAAYGTAQSVTDDLGTANYKHVSSATAAITGAGTPAAGEFAQIRVYRDVSEDGLTADARLMSVILTYHGK